MNKVTPVLKWVGGKRQSIPTLQKYYDRLKFKEYHEPFFGGGSVFLDINSKHQCISHISDFNSDLINLYKDIKSNPDLFIKTLEELKEQYSEKDYYYFRSRFNGVDREKNEVEKYTGITRSCCLMLLNKTCFNGLYRVNGKGLFNVPKGDYKNPKILDRDNILDFSKSLPEVENIHFEDFRDCEKRIKKGDLVYFDPPYHPLSETSSFTQYTSIFGENEQIELYQLFKRLDEKGVLVLLSNSSSEFILDMYKEFKPEFILSGRSINSKGSKRGKVKEVLVVGKTIKRQL